MTALQLEPTHQGAHRGLGFLYYRSGDLRRALRHLDFAAEAAPEDAGLRAAIERVRNAGSAPAVAEPGASVATPVAVPVALHVSAPASTPDDAELFAGLDGSRDGLLLLDQHGLRLGGGIRNDDGADVSDAVAAHLAGIARDAARAARLLGLGAWQSVGLECAFGNAHLVAPSAESILLTVRDVSVPAGRLALVADRAAQVARRWLEGLR
jgi:predicted regulator of Ras-like GTPase activity (Roadblock/LC7/MglB family)